MSFKNNSEILPPGLKTRPGINGNQRLPSITSLVSSLKGSSLTNNIALTRGGVAKRTYKPKIPLERNKNNKLPNEDIKPNLNDIKPKLNGKETKKSDLKNNRKQKDFIQLEGNLEGFKIDASSNKNKNLYYNKNFGGTQDISKFDKKSKKYKLENDFDDNKFKSIKTEKTDITNLLSSEEEIDDDPGDDELPICWEKYTSLLSKCNLNEETEDLEKKLERGRLILMPCIFGTLSGDTGYKMQILKSGKVRLVNKKTGFIIDLLNTDGLENDGYKEVVELDNDKLLRYGTIKNEDIYLPIRNIDSNYDCIFDD